MVGLFKCNISDPCNDHAVLYNIWQSQRSSMGPNTMTKQIDNQQYLLNNYRFVCFVLFFPFLKVKTKQSVGLMIRGIFFNFLPFKWLPRYLFSLCKQESVKLFTNE